METACNIINTELKCWVKSDSKGRMKAETEPKEFESDWGELTRELLINILSRLSVEDRWRGAMLVCKSWFSAFKEPSLHSVFDLDPQFDSPLESTRWWTSEFEAKIDSMLQSVVQWTQSSLTQLRIRHCSDRSLALVALRFQLSPKFPYPFVWVFEWKVINVFFVKAT